MLRRPLAAGWRRAHKNFVNGLMQWQWMRSMLAHSVGRSDDGHAIAAKMPNNVKTGLAHA